MDSRQEWIAQLEQGIAAKERYLADCEAKNPTDYLRGLSLAWAGTGDIDFDYLMGIIRYELEEDRDCMWKAARATSGGRIMNDPTLEPLIRDLIAIDNEGLLTDLQHSFAQACREMGGPPAADERHKTLNSMQIAESLKARDIGKAAAHMLGINALRCEVIARDLLMSDPWTMKAAELIEQYKKSVPPSVPATEQASPTAEPKQEAKRKW